MFDGVPGIGDEIEDNLLQPVFVDQDRRDRVIQMVKHIDVLECELLADNTHDILDGTVDVHYFFFKVRLASKIPETLDDFREDVASDEFSTEW